LDVESPDYDSKKQKYSIVAAKKTGKCWSIEKKSLPLQPQNGKVLYGQLPWNPPGLDRSKGTWS